MDILNCFRSDEEEKKKKKKRIRKKKTPKTANTQTSADQAASAQAASAQSVSAQSTSATSAPASSVKLAPAIPKFGALTQDWANCIQVTTETTVTSEVYDPNNPLHKALGVSFSVSVGPPRPTHTYSLHTSQSAEASHSISALTNEIESLQIATSKAKKKKKKNKSKGKGKAKENSSIDDAEIESTQSMALKAEEAPSSQPVDDNPVTTNANTSGPMITDTMAANGEISSSSGARLDTVYTIDNYKKATDTGEKEKIKIALKAQHMESYAKSTDPEKKVEHRVTGKLFIMDSEGYDNASLERRKELRDEMTTSFPDAETLTSFKVSRDVKVPPPPTFKPLRSSKYGQQARAFSASGNRDINTPEPKMNTQLYEIDAPAEIVYKVDATAVKDDHVEKTRNCMLTEYTTACCMLEMPPPSHLTTAEEIDNFQMEQMAICDKYESKFASHLRFTEEELKQTYRQLDNGKAIPTGKGSPRRRVTNATEDGIKNAGWDDLEMDLAAIQRDAWALAREQGNLPESSSSQRQAEPKQPQHNIDDLLGSKSNASGQMVTSRGGAKENPLSRALAKLKLSKKAKSHTAVPTATNRGSTGSSSTNTPTFTLTPISKIVEQSHSDLAVFSAKYGQIHADFGKLRQDVDAATAKGEFTQPIDFEAAQRRLEQFDRSVRSRIAASEAQALIPLSDKIWEEYGLGPDDEVEIEVDADGNIVSIKSI
jgi:hypothetical protein